MIAALAGLALAASPPTFYPANGPYPFSEAVRAGDFLILSGQLGAKPDGSGLAQGGIEAETRQTMENIGAALEKRGLRFTSLVKCTAMLADMKDWPAFNTVYASYFAKGHYPARSAFGANGLALGARVELECWAYAPRR